MRIADSRIYAGVTHSALAATEINESLRLWAGEPGSTPQAAAEDRVSLSTEGSRRQKCSAGSCSPCTKAQTDAEDMVGSHLWLAKLIIEAFTGIKVDLTNLARMKENPPEVEAPASDPGSADRTVEGRDGWGVAYDRSETYREEESLSFNARGVVRTADGQDIEFALDFELKRSYVEQNNFRFRAGDAAKVDPLVIHYGGSAASLSGGRFAFDIDADGREDTISAPGAGSGFLVLDRNGDGIANDGSELFGPSTGEGFAELAAFDTDRNRWIDENDTVYDRLRIWSRDGSGNEAYHSLQDQAIGAIYLGAFNAPFDYRDESNRLQGTVRASGLYLREGGGAGSIQQIDFAV